ncbi:MAG: CoA transferase subunit A [Lachnotalea sp.]
MIENIYNKIQNLEDAMEYMTDNMTLMCSGFGGVGTPPLLCDEIRKKNVKNITLISNDAGFPNVGVGPLVCNGHVKQMITTHIGSNPFAGKLMNEGKMDVEFIPQGTFCEQIRAGGVGLGGILVDSGIDTIIGEGKKTVMVNKVEYMIAPALRAKVGIIYAKKADPFGNLVYNKTARGNNPLIAMACDFTIVQVEEIVPLGSLNPEEIVTPGVFVDMIVTGKGGEWTWVWQQEK